MKYTLEAKSKGFYAKSIMKDLKGKIITVENLKDHQKN